MHRTLITLCVAVALSGCQKTEKVTSSAPPPAPTATQPQNLANAKVNQVLPMNAAESLAQSAISKDSVKSGEPVSVTVTLKDSPKGAQLSSRWYDAKNKQIAEEKKTLNGEKTVTFAWSGKKLKPGKYRVITYWGENVAGEHAFTVTK